MGDITVLLAKARDGDQRAFDDLFDALYPELRRIAHARLAPHKRGTLLDTTILVHLSADRSRAYAVSIPRDSIVDRPGEGCNGDAASNVMWNAAYSVGGPVCTLA